MATAGPNQFAAVAEFDDGEQPWSNVGNAITDNDGYATVSVGEGSKSNFLDYGTAGLTGPADGDAVTDVTFEVACKDVVAGAKLLSLQILVAGLPVGDVLGLSAAIGSSEAYVGNAPNTSVVTDFNTTLTGAQVKASGFGVRAQFQSNDSSVVSVDAARVTVTYTAGALFKAAWARGSNVVIQPGVMP